MKIKHLWTKVLHILRFVHENIIKCMLPNLQCFQRNNK